MAGVLRTVSFLVLALVPGGLLVLGAWVYGRVIARQLHAQPGPQRARLARAVAQVQWRDVWAEVRRVP